MLSSTLKRGLQYIPVVVIVISVNFFLPRLMPGDPLELLGGEAIWLLPPEAREELIEKHGLDEPLLGQYVQYLANLIRGDLGKSYNRGIPVSQVIMERLPWTLLLTGTSLVLSTTVGVLLGTLAGWKRGKVFDVLSLAVSMSASSIPSFFLGMILIAVFAVQFRLLPVFGARSPWVAYKGLALVVDIGRHLVLPACSLALLNVSNSFLLMRYSMLDVLGSDYVFMARAKGLGVRKVVFKHAMRNALLPMATAVMLSVGFMLSGAIVTETVFAYPGIGRLMYEAALGRDYPLLQGIFLIISITVIGANFLSDLLYPLLDPRVRRAGREQ